MNYRACAVCLLFSLAFVTGPLAAQEKPQATPDNPPASETTPEARFEQFQKMLSGVHLVGNFTIAGREAKELKEERYEIKQVKKLPAGDLWLFEARIRYGEHDVTLPIPLEVKWAGNTPIITLDNVTIPGLGTFDARVVLHDGKYAGTWRHGNVSGHLFGTIEKAPDPSGSSGKAKAEERP
ncbi:MAG: hypothetical protein KatS3mg110_2024 [Pirellulaceae bacterium]|nr:MAG: hypothetical protein KatS3mg110_2024 [Pirellulaceae bacterium]